MSKLAKINLIPAPPPLVDPRRALLVGGYFAVLLLLGYLTLGAYLRTQVYDLDLQVTQARTDLATRTVQRQRQVAVAQAANDAKQKLVDELGAMPLWSALIPDLLAKVPAGVSLTSPIKLDRSLITFSARAKTYQDLVGFRDGLKGTRYGNVSITGPDWNVDSRDFAFAVRIVLTGGK